jgi:hypothetical protein
MTYLGLDPGVSGGIAVLDEHGTVKLAVKMPATEKDVLDFLREHGGSGKAVLEFVRSSPAMGVVSAFTFGRGYGGLKMALLACGISCVEVTPQKWQMAMGCRSGGDKNVTKRKAQELFPALPRVTHNTADALLLAEYARRMDVRP